MPQNDKKLQNKKKARNSKTWQVTARNGKKWQDTARGRERGRGLLIQYMIIKSRNLFGGDQQEGKKTDKNCDI